MFSTVVSNALHTVFTSILLFYLNVFKSSFYISSFIFYFLLYILRVPPVNASAEIFDNIKPRQPTGSGAKLSLTSFYDNLYINILY